MLLVNAKAEASKIKQLGLVAQEFIVKGRVIWKFQPGFDLRLTVEEFTALPEPVQNQVRYYAYFCKASKTFLLSRLPCDGEFHDLDGASPFRKTMRGTRHRVPHMERDRPCLRLRTLSLRILEAWAMAGRRDHDVALTGVLPFSTTTLRPPGPRLARSRIH